MEAEDGETRNWTGMVGPIFPGVTEEDDSDQECRELGTGCCHLHLDKNSNVNGGDEGPHTLRGRVKMSPAKTRSDEMGSSEPFQALSPTPSPKIQGQIAGIKMF